MAVAQTPPNKMVFRDPFRGLTKVNTSRDIHITSMPVMKATATDRKMAAITLRALSVFRSSPRPGPSSRTIFTSDRASAPPSISNTKETVVDVGIPRELKMSRRITSVTITARKMQITS